MSMVIAASEQVPRAAIESIADLVEAFMTATMTGGGKRVIGYVLRRLQNGRQTSRELCRRAERGAQDISKNDEMDGRE